MNGRLRDGTHRAAPNVLLVDSEAGSRSELRRSLARRGCHTIEAADAVQAFRLLSTTPVDAVLAQEQLPDLLGVDFLERVLRDWPEISRVLVSASTDPRVALQAVNRARVPTCWRRPSRPRASTS